MVLGTKYSLYQLLLYIYPRTINIIIREVFLYKICIFYAIIRDMLLDQKSSIHREAGFPDVDRLQTGRGHRNLRTELGQVGQCSENINYLNLDPRTYCRLKWGRLGECSGL